MIRFVIYALILVGSAVGTALIFANRQTFSPRLMALAAPMTITLAYGSFMVVRVLLFWSGGFWWQESPVSPYLAMAGNAVVLSWVSTSLVVLFDKIWQQNGR